jgi:putative transposase
MSYPGEHYVLYICQYPMVFCPKCRRKVMVGGFEQRPQETLLPVSKGLGCELELEEMLDQVHLLYEVDPKLGMHPLVKWAKRSGSRCGHIQMVYRWLEVLPWRS